MENFLGAEKRMIRPGRLSDFEAIEAMLKEFDCTFSGLLPGRYDRAYFRAFYDGLVSSRLGHVSVLDLGGPKGVLMGQCSSWSFAPVTAAQEIMWWCDPEVRGAWGPRLLAGFETWAQSLGAKMIAVSSIDGRADTLFTRRGYVAAETNYYRVIA